MPLEGKDYPVLFLLCHSYREDSEHNFYSSYCKMASQVSKALGAFLLSISEQVKNIGKPKQRMPAQYELKSCIQLI